MMLIIVSKGRSFQDQWLVCKRKKKKETHMEMRKFGVCQDCGWRLKHRQRLEIYEECMNSWQTLMK